MGSIAKNIETLEKTAGNINKEAALKKMDTAAWRKFLKYVFSESKYYVKKYEKKSKGHETFESCSKEIYKLLGDLASRKITGNAAVEAVEKIYSRLDKSETRPFECLLNKDLKVGVSSTTIKKIYPDILDDKISVALAQKFEPKYQSLLEEGTWYISRKLDGMRCIAKNEGGEWSFWSRGNKEITTLDNLKKDLETLNLSNVVFDGELCIVDENGKEDFQSIMKEARKKDHTIEHPMYMVFDMIPLDVFEEGRGGEKLSERQKKLSKIFSANPRQTVRVLTQTKYNEENFQSKLSDVSKYGWEGLMLRKDTEYRGERTRDLMKVKNFSDFEAEVKDVEIGELVFQESGKGMKKYVGVTALVIEYKGNEVRVGSGMTKEQRIEWKNDPSKIIGNEICVKYFAESRNQDGTYSLRFPTLKYVYEGKRDC